LKNASLNYQAGGPVILVVVYLRKGRYRQFPSEHVIRAEGLSNTYHLHTIRLWEHRDRIRSGELGALAPLLVLCEDNPDERTLQDEREIIRNLLAPEPVKNELIGLAVMLGARFFSEDVLTRYSTRNCMC
jgi:hypothetical protein